ncbi:CHRNN [Lepeophtheirus salmonis]|uniref:CHRNN n=1 Tax=Lepeophtheirus salmonis TaxID=72036 RepID=A0A7R8D1H5_LEPSM|nr:CHRNN [Lepeophtheirus salmonis]CAF2995381.1 CHRNN [Lepeophtheirus salmonis]
MAPWIRRVFIHILPRLLVMRRPHYDLDKHRSEVMKNPRYTFMTPDNEYLDEHQVAELLNSSDMQDYLHQQRQYQKMSSNRQYHHHYQTSKQNLVPNNTRMNNSSLHNRNYSRYGNHQLSRKGEGMTSPPQTHNRILVRTCNGLELRDPPYIPNSSGGGGGYLTTTTTNNAINRGNVFQQAKSSMSHHSFKSSRSFHDDQNELQGLPLNGSCRLHGQSADHLPLRSNNQQPGSPTADSEMGENWKHSSSNNNNNHLNKTNNRISDVCPEVSKALSGVMLIAEQKKRLEESTKVRNIMYP